VQLIKALGGGWDECALAYRNVGVAGNSPL